MAFSFMSSGMRDFMSWLRARGAQATIFGTGCCKGLAAEDCGAQPEISDLLIVLGPLTEKGAEHLRSVYERMPGPRRVVAAGACAASGGWPLSYSAASGAVDVIPVDRYVPGCPPEMSEIMAAVRAVMRLQAKEGESL